MKKLLCIALFSVITLTNAKNKLEIVKNNYENEKIEMTTDLEIINFIDFSQSQNLETYNVAGCGTAGNVLYDNLMASGNYTHRMARAERRSFVRECRGLPEGGWLPSGGKILSVALSIYGALN